MARTALLLILACLAGWSPVEDGGAVDLDQFEKDLPERRRRLEHAVVLIELESLAKAGLKPDQDARFAAALEQVAGEKRLLERLSPLDRLSGRQPADLIEALAGLELDAAEELGLARLALLHSLAEPCEAALARCRDRDESLKPASDEILARLRDEELPRGGYFRYRGRFVAMELRDRQESLDQALESVQKALGAERLEGFVTRSDEANLERFQRRFGADGSALLRRAADSLREALAADYARVRGWLPSYSRQPSLRRNMVVRLADLAKPRRALRGLIGRYDKPQQPQVDAGRRELEQLYQRYEELLVIDRRALKAIGVDAGYALLQRVRNREDALAALDRYLAGYGGGGLDAADVIPDADAETTAGHLLPGRNHSGLEDVLWLLVHVVAEQDVGALDRAEELLRQRNRLTGWERLISDELLALIIERYNERCASSLDPEERRFMTVLNRYRRVLGLRPFEIEERLNVASRKHSREMVDLGYFGHVSPVARNRTPGDRVRLEGYGGGVGENCLGGRCDGRAAFEAWYHSPGHHRNLVSGGIHLGVGATADHAMWTMVAGGADVSWRHLHRDLAPDQRRDLDGLSTRAADHLIDHSLQDELRAAVADRAPEILAFLGRLAFRAASDRKSPHKDCWPELMRLLVESEPPTEWRPLQIAAVAAAIDGMEWDPRIEARKAAWALVSSHVETGLDYQPKASPRDRRVAVARIRADWEDISQYRFRQGAEATAPQAVLPPGRSAEGPALAAPLKVLSERERLALAKRNGGGSATEKALDRALTWLVKNQDKDGGWRSRSFVSLDKRYRGEEKGLGQGNAEWEVGMTGLSLLALIAAGNTPEQGKHQESVARGVQFLSERIVDYGKFETTSSHYMYNHAIATQALCEAYAYTADPRIGVSAQLCVDYLAYAQHSLSGGWRYRANEAGDSSVTGWVVMALNSAYKARLDVAGFRGALRFLDSVTWPAYFRIGYTNRQDGGTVRLGAVGMLCRLFLEGNKQNPHVLLNAWRLKRHLPRKGGEDYYYWYYGTLALFQLGGEFWETWNAALVPALLEMQVDDARSPFHGSWNPRGEWSNVGGRIYQTALGALMLTTYYRYDRLRTPRVVPFTGDPARLVGPYIEALRGDDELARTVGGRKMVDLFGEAAAAEVIRLLRAPDEEKEFRRRLAPLLLDCVGPNHETALLGLLEIEKDDDVHAALLLALEGVGSRRSVPKLIPYLDHAVREMRVYAARALGSIGDPTAAVALNKRLEKESDNWCKQVLTESLTRLSHRREIDRFLEDLYPGGGGPRLRLLSGLGILDRSGVANNLTKTRKTERPLYDRALNAAKTHGQAAAVPILMILLESTELDTRNEAFKLLQLLSGQNHGFVPDQPEEDRLKSLQRWQAWWQDRVREYELERDRDR